MPKSVRAEMDQRRAGEVFRAFLQLGLTSFGGPIAHLGFFHAEFVKRRAWFDDNQFTQLLGLCQSLPGPASSQLGFAIGLVRAGWLGGVAAFVGFALPSALLLLAFAGLAPYTAGPFGTAAIHGLKLVAVAVVAQGILAMARTLTPDMPRAVIAAAAATILVITAGPALHVAVIVAGGALGALTCRHVSAQAPAAPLVSYGRIAAVAWLALFGILLFALPLLARPWPNSTVAMVDAFYRSGALVFGGGHVVLPLLREAVVEPGWVTTGDFLAGYGAAQAVPGPMFTLAAYLGARMSVGGGGLWGGILAMLGIFLPGLLLVASALPFWSQVAASRAFAHVLAGVNAAVVGLLVAALYDPVWVGAVHGPGDLAIALVGFTLLVAWRASALWVVGWCVLASLGLALVW
jgi:chromate transporter